MESVDRGTHACGSRRHAWTRRGVLQSLLGMSAWGAGAAASSRLVRAAQTQRKQVLFVWLDGAMSQFESWDPKPGTRFGGPFRDIATRVPGVRLSELMPRMAERMDRFSIVRSLHTRYEDHSKGLIPIQQGDPKNRGVAYPLFGSAVARLYAADNDPLPPYIHIKPGSGGFMYQDGGFLGAKYGALALGDGKAPANLIGPPSEATSETSSSGPSSGSSSAAASGSPLGASRVAMRDAIRQQLDDRYASRRDPELAAAYRHTYQVARQMARHAELFAPERLQARDIERYGSSEFGRHLLQARQLIEAGVAFVKVTMFHWDTHGDNFNCHQDGVPQVDTALAALIDDLVDRGLYERTLVVVMSEFGRTPKINARVGRDHWPECWSMGVGGGGIRPGVVVGRTNELGTFNQHEEYDVGHLFHTFFRALGIDPATTEYDNDGQPLPIAHDDCGPIKELLA